MRSFPHPVYFNSVWLCGWIAYLYAVRIDSPTWVPTAWAVVAALWLGLWLRDYERFDG